MSGNDFEKPASKEVGRFRLNDEMLRTIDKHVTVSRDGTRLEVSTLGISFGDFDRSGDISLFAIAMYFSSIRLFILTSSQHFASKVIENQLMFLLQIEYEISQTIYRLGRAKIIWLPMKFITDLISIGRTTFTFECKMFGTTSDGEQLQLARSIFKMAKVNRATRKSQQLPEHVLVKYNAYSNSAVSLKPLSIPEPPINGYSSEFVMRLSDTDYNGHTNNTRYLQICQDCASMAALCGGYLNHFTGDITKHLVKAAKCVYLKESRAGDILKVFVWEDTIQPDSLHFIITNENITSFYCLMEFHQLINSRL